MNLTISSLLILVVALPHSSFAMRILEDTAEVNKVMRNFSINVEDKSIVGGDHDHRVRRKVLHEVHSGTNPVGNSIDQQQRLIPKSRSTIP